MITLTLPFPDRALSPNSRRHWKAKLDPKQAARMEAWTIAHNTGRVLPPGKYQAWLTFCPPNNKRRDLDNLLAAEKPTIDGLCAGLGIDDSCIKRVTLEWGEVYPNGKVIFHIGALENAYRSEED